MKRVQILLSTFNGEKYLEEQLQSILNQNFSIVSVLIRDDGSSDNTIKIIEKYCEIDSRITFYKGSNIGVQNSFFDLIKNSDPDVDYYSLSDQDDVWKAGKISSAVKMLSTYDDQPALYSSDKTLVNEKLEVIDNIIKKTNYSPDFGNALVENICSGCTCVFNHKLMHIIKNNIPDFAVMHDWWIYLCASAFGKVVYDKESYILYRQHSNNTVGSSSNFFDEFKRRITNYKKNRGKLYQQIGEFSKLKNIGTDKLILITLILESKIRLTNRAKIIFNNKIYRQRKMDDVIFKMLFLLGKI